MEVLLAAQPIFDIKQKVYGYEILYRGSRNSTGYDSVDPDAATSRVIIDCFQTIGLMALTGNKPAFINFTSNLLATGVATLFPSTELVVEILETVSPDKEILAQCRNLKALGYTLALDDFVYSDEYEELIDLADIVKVDFLNTASHERRSLATALRGRACLLAEKVESQESFDEAVDLGYTLFQGFFFCKPVIVSAQDIAPFKFSYLQLIREVNAMEVDLNKVADIILKDVSLSYRLLSMVNSVHFGLRARVTSIKQALVILGEKELRKWVSLLVLKGMSQDKPDELMRLTLVRARFLELLSHRVKLEAYASDLFLMGLFSLLDVFMNRPLDELLEKANVSSEIRVALIGGTGRFGNLLKLVLSYEQGNWEQVAISTTELRIDAAMVWEAYQASIAWYEDNFLWLSTKS